MNLPNKITVARMFLVPIFLLVLALPLENNELIAVIIFAVFFIGDFFDGYFARKRNQVTNLGKFLDPLADKLMVATALIYLTGKGIIPAWITYTIIGRELIVTALRTTLHQNNTPLPASWLGKTKTAIQSVSIALILFNKTYFYFLIYIALFFTIISGLEYLFRHKKIIKSFFNVF